LASKREKLAETFSNGKPRKKLRSRGWERGAFWLSGNARRFGYRLMEAARMRAVIRHGESALQTAGSVNR
jgi:hypothetical protein